MRPLALLLLIVVVAGACTPPPVAVPPPVAPRRTNNVWLRLETKHFELSTDLAPEGAKRAAEFLERTRGALVAAAGSWASDSAVTSRMRVVVFGDERDFVGGYERSAYVWPWRPTLFMWGSTADWEGRETSEHGTSTKILRAELVHRLAAAAYRRLPPWFAEGLALFFETVVISEDGRTATVGRINARARASYTATRGASVRDLLASHSDHAIDRRTRDAPYGLSWLLVHFLYDTQPAALAVFKERLAQGADPAAAWSASFRDVRLDELDKQLEQYSRAGKFTEFTTPLKRVVLEPTGGKAVTASDVLGIRAQLALFMSLHTNDPMELEARQGVERALALEPGNALALRLSRWGHEKPPPELVAKIREQVARQTDDGEAWLLLAQALDATDEREAAYRRALTLMPLNATAQNDLAFLLVSTGRGEAALPLAASAAGLQPWSAPTLDTYAAALFASGRCPEALTTQLRAVDLISERRGESVGGLSPYAPRLATYAKACGAAGP